MIIPYEQMEELRRGFLESVDTMSAICPDQMQLVKTYIDILYRNELQMLMEGEISNEALRDKRGTCQILNTLLAEFSNSAILLREYTDTHPSEDEPES